MEKEELKYILDSLVEPYVKVDVPLITPSDLSTMLFEIGGEEIDPDNIDTNGWDIDFWIYFYYNDKKFCFAGSWFYGNYVIQLVEND